MMPNAVRHTIRQQYLHVEVNGTESDALALQNRLSGLCQDWLMPALDRAFDHCVPADENWFIERLEIDAGTLSLDRLEQDLADIVAKAVEKTIQEQITISVDEPVTDTRNVQRKTSHQSIDEAFIYFLQTGRLPWAFRLPKGESLESALLGAWNQSGQHTFYFEDAVRGALASVIARKRLLRQFSAHFLQTLLARLSSESSKAILAVLPTLHSVDAPTADVKLFTRQLWETTFALIATGKPITGKQLVYECWRTLPMPLANPAKLANLLERHWLGSTASSNLAPTKLSLANQKLVQAILQTLSKSDLTTFTKKQFEYHLRQTISTVSPTDKTLTEQALVSETWRSLPATLQQAELENLLERHWPGSTSASNPSPSGLSLANQTLIQAILQTLDKSDLTAFTKKQFEDYLRQTISAVSPTDQTLTEHALVSETWHRLPATLQQAALTNLLERHWPGSTSASNLAPPLFSRLSLANQKLIQVVLQALDNSNLADFTKKQFEHHLWQIISAVSPTDQTLTEHSLVSQTWYRLPATLQQEALANLLERHWPDVTQSVNQYKHAIEEAAANEAESKRRASADAKEGIYIENAGLVLLHPFLPQFFEALGIVAEDNLLR